MSVCTTPPYKTARASFFRVVLFVPPFTSSISAPPFLQPTFRLSPFHAGNHSPRPTAPKSPLSPLTGFTIFHKTSISLRQASVPPHRFPRYFLFPLLAGSLVSVYSMCADSSPPRVAFPLLALLRQNCYFQILRLFFYYPSPNWTGPFSTLSLPPFRHVVSPSNFQRDACWSDSQSRASFLCRGLP